MKHTKHNPPGGRNPRAEAPTTPPAATHSSQPPRLVDEVSKLAYQSYVKQGFTHGNDVRHWLDAEAQLLSESNTTRIPGLRYEC